ncbi:sirohydrochlorin chelatase [Actinoplanes solisilvae]|uniref:sirohydrochlorin chelatase n=1 Tax=Actinoplanes solisilvae TaxID=2486853 RepID=UPI000FDAE867|nr:CbiX/SirB N-terminal domain-containing protein [Actinoplanes solisilvae]
MPTLIAVAHGTRNPAGQAQIRDLVARVAARRTGLDVRLSYVDVQEPKVAAVVQAAPDAVVVPLLLSTGYHVRVDIADAVAGTPIPVSRPLGPDDVLLDSLLRHLPPADAVVLAAAGSSDPAWRADIDRLATQVANAVFPSGHRLPRPPRDVGAEPRPERQEEAGLSTGGAAAGCSVDIGYVSGPGPRVPDVVADLRRRGARRIAIAAYLLADGLFYRTLGRAGADHVTPPLCLDPAVTDLVLARFESALLTTAPTRL